jgi:hypothetical protein
LVICQSKPEKGIGLKERERGEGRECEWRDALEGEERREGN